MKLPNGEHAIVPRAKVVDYLLSDTHRDGRHKATFFKSFGFAVEAWEMLARALREHAAEHDVVLVQVSPPPQGGSIPWDDSPRVMHDM